MPKRSPPIDMVLNYKKKGITKTMFGEHVSENHNEYKTTYYFRLYIIGNLLKIIFDQNGWTLPNPPTSVTFNMFFVRPSVVFLFPETSFFSAPRPLFSQYPPVFLSIVNSSLAIFTTVCLCGSGFVVRLFYTVVSPANTANYRFLPNPVRSYVFNRLPNRYQCR